MTRAEILDCLTDRPCEVCKFHESGRCERWDCVFEEKPDDAEADAISRISVLDTLDTTDEFMDEERTVENYKALLKECYEVLPSVIPQQRVGCWIHTDECDEEWQYRCSICNMPSRSNAHRYCSKCGSYMYGIKPQESEG
jgi:hypothetical protein